MKKKLNFRKKISIQKLTYTNAVSLKIIVHNLGAEDVLSGIQEMKKNTIIITKYVKVRWESKKIPC